MTASSSASDTTTGPNGIVLLPATKFFVRRIPLVVGQDVMSQVELALESIGPFTPGQLYYGYCPSRDGAHALIFAAYRRVFPPADTEGWNSAQVVLPEFAAWLNQPAEPPTGVWWHEQDNTLTALVWDGTSDLPAGLISRETTPDSLESVRAGLQQEVTSRFPGVTGAAQTFRDGVVVGALDKEGLGLGVGDRSVLLSPAQLRMMDVRDKTELTAQFGRQKRDRLLWLAFASVVAGFAACLVVEGGLQVSNGLLARQRHGLEAAAAPVRQIEQANQLALRMENLAGQSLRPFEMLTVLNNARPASLEFVRASTGKPRQMEIEAQSGNAADPPDYEKALMRLAEIEKVELQNLRASGGKTTFQVVVTFKSGWVGQKGTR